MLAAHDIELRMQRLISRVLMIGMALSGSLMIVGFALYAFQPSWYGAAIPPFGRNLLAGGPGAVALNPYLYLYGGILLLMCTPIVRVCIGIGGFAREKDWRYVAISTAVLAVIALSIVLSIVH